MTYGYVFLKHPNKIIPMVAEFDPLDRYCKDVYGWYHFFDEMNIELVERL